MQLDWSSIFQIKTVKDDLLKKLLEPFESVFKDELGTFTGDKISIHIDLSVVPSQTSMKEMVDKELQRLEDLGIIKSVTSSKWAAPIVPVLKPDRKSIRLQVNC